MSIIFHMDRHFKRNKAALKSASTGNNNGIFLKGDNGCTIILVHGLTGTPNEMKSLANYFHKQGYSIICPRLAYHGEPLRVLKHAKWRDFYGTIRDAYLHSEAAKNGEPVFAAGLSMGALLALNLVDEFPGKIAGVSCLAPTIFFDGWNATWLRCLLPLAYLTPLKYFFYFKEDPPYGIKNERIRNFIHRYYVKARIVDDDYENISRYGYPFFPVSLLRQIDLAAKHTIKRLPYITTPLQLIQAEEDDVSSVKSSEIIRDKAGSKIKEMHLLYESYHIITADQEREKVAELMELFFKRLRSKKNNERR
ncbi:MAG: alpha/beta fold hydrolase [Candidatus Omnitrophica bacterium]|nr:alpha/beta fold hydrolase [Candidatus Omnitrophota bacterium]